MQLQAIELSKAAFLPSGQFLTAGKAFAIFWSVLMLAKD